MLYPTHYGPILLCPPLNRVPYAWINCQKSFRALASKNLCLTCLGRSSPRWSLSTVCEISHALAVICNKTETARQCTLARAPNPITLVTIHRPIKVLVDADKEGQGLCAAECASRKAWRLKSKGLPRHFSDTFARRQLKHLLNSYRFFPTGSPSSRRGSV